MQTQTLPMWFITLFQVQCIWSYTQWFHYNDVIMSLMASQITSLTIVYSIVYSKLRTIGLCAGNSPVTGEFPAQMNSNAENISIWWRHHVRNIPGASRPYWLRPRCCDRMPNSSKSLSTHRSRVTYICVAEMSHGQAIIWTHAGILIIEPLGIYFIKSHNKPSSASSLYLYPSWRIDNWTIAN